MRTSRRRSAENPGFLLLCAISLYGSAILPALADPQTAVFPAWTTRLATDGDIRAVGFSADGSFFLSVGAEGVVRTFVTVTQKESGPPLKAEVWSSASALSVGSKQVAFGRSAEGPWKDIQVWNLDTRQFLRTLSGHRDDISALAFGAAGRQLISGDEHGVVKLWDVTTGRRLRTLFSGLTRSAITAVALAAEGQVAAAGLSSGRLSLWSAATGKQLMMTKAHGAPLRSLAISANGQRVLSGGEDGIALWQPPEPRAIWRDSDAAELTAVALSAGGELGAGSGRTLELWNAATGELLASLIEPEKMSLLAISPDGQWILGTYGFVLCLWPLPAKARALFPLPKNSTT